MGIVSGPAVGRVPWNGQARACTVDAVMRVLPTCILTLCMLAPAWAEPARPRGEVASPMAAARRKLDRIQRLRSLGEDEQAVFSLEQVNSDDASKEALLEYDAQIAAFRRLRRRKLKQLPAAAAGGHTATRTCSSCV